jgi:hypothetical protein
MTPTDIAITVVLMASPAMYTGERNADLANDIVEPEAAEVVAADADAGEAGSDCDKGTGFRPACVTTVPTVWRDFGPGRPIWASGVELGSGGKVTKDVYTVPSGGVLVHNLNMSGDSTTGRVVFAPSGNTGGLALRLWVSSSPDGPMVGGCGYVGYSEGVLYLSTDGSQPCSLSQGGSYYLNAAMCASVPSDPYCSDPSARTQDTGARIVMMSYYF